jgi:hypothetical protein
MNFQEVFQWVAIIAFNRTKSFSDLMDALSASPDIAGHASKPWEKQPFVELISAQKSMDQINELFTEGLSVLDVVISQFRSMISDCSYVFSLKAHLLGIEFKDEKKQHKTFLSHAHVLDFEQRLGFAQHEKKAAEYEIAPYLKQLQEYRRLLKVMCELHALGHKEWTKSTQNLKCKRLDECSLTLDHTLDAWKAFLEQISRENEYLCFFSISTVQQIDALIRKQSSYELALLLSPLFPRSSAGFQTLLNVCDRVLRKTKVDKSL